jgi:hypothetical protein
MREPPQYGSLLEVLCLIIWQHRQQVMIAGVRAQAQAALGGDAAVEAFKAFKTQVQKIEVEDRENKMRSALKEWSKVSEVRFKPVSGMGQTPVLESTVKQPEADSAEAQKARIRNLINNAKTKPLPRTR